jgi:hypothetical protein|nr:MAG TPA: putative phosphohydrolase [Bacteriophage sp.]
MIQLLHISDTHAFAEGARDAVALSQRLGIPLVHTGDMVQDYYGQDITYAYPGAMLFCLGNHDVWTKTLPRQYTEQSKLYATYYAPYASGRNCVQTAPDTWWYKDIGGVRLISLDCLCDGSVMARQLTWLENVIAECEWCVVLSHMAPRSLQPHACCMTCSAYYSTTFVSPENQGQMPYTPGLKQLYDALLPHKDKILLELCGHEHSDCIGMAPDWLVSVVGSTLIDSYNNVYRSADTVQNRCVANLVRIAPGDFCAIYRLGAIGRTNGERGRMVVYDYKTKRFSTMVSR